MLQSGSPAICCILMFVFPVTPYCRQKSKLARDHSYVVGVWCWCMVLVYGVVESCWCMVLVIVLVYRVRVGVPCWCIVLVYRVGVSCWCIVLVYRVGESCWCMVLVIVLVYRVGVSCWCIVLVYGRAVGRCPIGPHTRQIRCPAHDPR